MTSLTKTSQTMTLLTMTLLTMTSLTMTSLTMTSLTMTSLTMTSLTMTSHRGSDHSSTEKLTQLAELLCVTQIERDSLKDKFSELQQSGVIPVSGECRLVIQVVTV